MLPSVLYHTNDPHARRKGDAMRERIVSAITDLSTELGRPPKVREIGARVGVKSTGHISWHLARLEVDGVLTNEYAQACGYRLATSIARCPGCHARDQRIAELEARIRELGAAT